MIATTVSTERVRPSMQVIEALAEATDSDPREMEPLYGVLDPDALDRLFADDVSGRISFRYDGHAVEFTSDGTVVIDGSEYGGR